MGWNMRSCECKGVGIFGFDIHHRFSDPIRGMLPQDDLPEKGSQGYYVAMAHRDRLVHGRRLLTNNDDEDEKPTLTFFNGNDTYLYPQLGLHGQFWLPCDCESKCFTGLKNSAREVVIKLNVYSPNTSSTSQSVSCSSSLCESKCSRPTDSCPYQVRYLSANTSSTGFLVNDILHLTTDNPPHQSKPVHANITFGCGKVQSGLFLEGGAPNGLIGLADGIGRIEFGDEASSAHNHTPFNPTPTFPTYDITITQITVGPNTSNFNFSAIFDSGTSFTYLNDPAYTLITNKFDSLIEEKRYSSDPEMLFEFCYEQNTNKSTFKYPKVNLTMEGGHDFSVTNPLVPITISDTEYGYCLGILKSENANLIGQNFMTGYRLAFDREKMVLGWRKSNCYESDDEEKENNEKAPPNNPPEAPEPVPPSIAVDPQAPSTGAANNSRTQPAAPKKSHSVQLNPKTCAPLIFLIFVFLAVIV